MPRQWRAAPSPPRSASESLTELVLCLPVVCVTVVDFVIAPTRLGPIVSLVGSRDLKVVIDSYLRSPQLYTVSQETSNLWLVITWTHTNGF